MSLTIRCFADCLTPAATVVVSPNGKGFIPEIRYDRIVGERGQCVELACNTASIRKARYVFARVRNDGDSGSTLVPGVVLGATPAGATRQRCGRVPAEHKCDWLSRRLYYCRDQCAGIVDVLVQRLVRRGPRTITREDACAPQAHTAPPTDLQLREPLCAATAKAVRCRLEREPGPCDGWRS